MKFDKLIENALAEREAFINSERVKIVLGATDCRTTVSSLHTQIEKDLVDNNIDAQIINAGGLGWCETEPLMGIYKPSQPLVWYKNMTMERASRIISDCLITDKPVTDGALCCMQEEDFEGVTAFARLPFFQSQKRISLRNCGLIDPENINDYIVRGGYAGLANALKISSKSVIELIEKAELRGRGGAGFPTAEKWQLCLNTPGKEKYVICNAAEGDPQAFKDRAILEGDPHAVLEGILICAYAVEASSGVIFINETYETAISRVETALSQMKESDLIGKEILGSDFNFELEVKTGEAGLANGEETALINCLEGKRTAAYKRPPYPAESGLFGKPTCVNNVETLAHVSAILEKGPEGHTVTNIFTLSGEVSRSGLIEAPAGTTFRQIIHDMGGGIKGGGNLKAFRVGGYTGGWLTEEHLDMTPDYESLAEAGTIMGSGSLYVAGTDDCAVRLALQSLSIVETETCGKCVFGREGTMELAEILMDITEGRGREDDIDLLQDIGNAMMEGAFCGMCRSAPNPVLTTIKHFRDDYEAHLTKKKCPSGACK